VGLVPEEPGTFAFPGTTKAASALRFAARTPKHRRFSDANLRMPDNNQQGLPHTFRCQKGGDSVSSALAGVQASAPNGLFIHPDPLSYWQ
jgi:hypothetical protein